MAKPRRPPLTLGEETWGERVRRAYYRSKREFGHDWEDLASRVSQLNHCSHTALMDLMKYDAKPAKTAQLQRAWLFSLALGIDPAELDLYPEDIGSEHLASKTVADLLRPKSRCLAITAA